MFDILITALVICTDHSAYSQKIASSSLGFKHDVQLLRMGWYAEDKGRCKAVKITYKTGAVYE